MSKDASQFVFLIDYILKLLEDNKINLDEDQKKRYVPQMLAQLEVRLGLELIPKLNDAQKENFAKLVNDEKSTPEAWKKFWYTVPSFEEDVKRVMTTFAERVREILSK